MPKSFTSAALLVLVACGTAKPLVTAPAPPRPAPSVATSAPTSPPTATTPSEIPLDDQARALVDAIAHQRFEEAAGRFDATLGQTMPPPALAALWRKLEEASGPFQSIEDVASDVETDYHIVRVSC